VTGGQALLGAAAAEAATIEEPPRIGGARMRIIGPTSVAADIVRANLAAHFSPHARFIAEMFPALWSAGEKYSVDPVGVVAQSYKETAGGNYTGAVRPQFYNTCGLKIRHLGVLPEASGDQPLARSMFASWEVGAEAHVQHLRAYAGWPVEGALIVDPRYWLVSGSRLENWSDLGTRWAPSPTYGKEIETIMTRLGA
jgi:N-acetylmuramoyl-L-alanine amidase